MILHVNKTRRRRMKGNQIKFLVVFPFLIAESLPLHRGTGISRYALRGRNIPISIDRNINNNYIRAPLQVATSFSLFFGPSSHQDLPSPDQQELIESNNILDSTASFDSASSSSSSTMAPSLLRYPLTRAQLECLRVVELRVACTERGLKKTGTKAALQKRLMEWDMGQQQQQLDESKQNFNV